MPDTFNKTYRYTKGIYEAKVFSTANRDLLYYDNKLTDSNIASSVNIGEVTAGIGNAVVITLPDSAKFNVTLTAADVELRSRQLQTGGILGYNGITDVCEVIKASSTSLTLGSTPAVPYGYDKAVCYINGSGVAYEVDTSTKVVSGFTAEVDATYSVRYYVAKAASEVLDIKTLFNPEVVTLEIKYPVYEAATAAEANSGSLCGYIHAIVPRFQFAGEASLASNNTTPATSSLSGQALAYDSMDVNACQVGNLASLIYLVWEPISGTEGVVDIAVLGGGALSVKSGESATIPVKYIMADGMLAQPDMSDLSFVSAASGTASVSASGVVTGGTAGDTEITITNSDLGLVAYCNVTVTAS